MPAKRILPILGRPFNSENRRKTLTLFLLAAILILIGVGSLYLYDRYFSPKVKHLAEVDRIISLVQNPDPEQAAKFNPETLKNLNILIISGPQNPKNPSPEYAAVSLKGVAAAIEEGNNSLAQERIKSLILSSNLSAPRRTALGPGDAVKWKKEEIDLYDPERRIVPLGHIFFGYSKFREEVILPLFKLYYVL